MLAFEKVGLAKNGPEGRIEILTDVSFTVPDGRVFTILGPSGSGKSTLLRLACRLDDPDSGRITLSGTDLRDLPVLSLRRRVGLVFQEAALFGESVLENLEFAADPCGEGRPLTDPEGRLERVGLSPSLLARRPDALSVGQRQRVALARALVAEPELLLLDEPTSALDPPSATGILRLVGRLRDELGLTVVLVSHFVGQARQVADRVLVLQSGRVLEEGDATIFDAPRLPETRAFFAGEEE